jgi:hypothetical protein
MNLLGLRKDIDELNNTFYNMHCLSVHLDSSGRQQLTYEEQMLYSDMIYLIELRLLTLHNGMILHMAFPGVGLLDGLHHAACDGASIYINSTLRNIPLCTAMYNPRIRGVKDNLEQINLTYVCEHFPALLLWLLFVAGSAAIGRPQRVWFVQQLAAVSAALKLDCWESTKLRLREFFWFDRLYESKYLLLWKEMEAYSIDGPVHPPAIVATTAEGQDGSHNAVLDDLMEYLAEV